MNKVHPIKSIDVINKMIDYLRSKNHGGRDVLLFIMGINVALRISDLIVLKYDDIFTNKGVFKDYIRVVEKKTGKRKLIQPNKLVKEEVKKYVKQNDITFGDYLFYPNNDKTRHITRKIAWLTLSQSGKALAIQNFGTHSLRKTFGYHHYRVHKDIAGLMRLFNHSNTSTTLKYIGVEQDEINTIYQNVGDIYTKGE